MKDRLRKRRRSMAIPEKYRVKSRGTRIWLIDRRTGRKIELTADPYRVKLAEFGGYAVSEYAPDGWPKDLPPLPWRGTFRRDAKTGMLYRDTEE